MMISATPKNGVIQKIANSRSEYFNDRESETFTISNKINKISKVKTKNDVPF